MHQLLSAFIHGLIHIVNALLYRPFILIEGLSGQVDTNGCHTNSSIPYCDIKTQLPKSDSKHTRTHTETSSSRLWLNLANLHTRLLQTCLLQVYRLHAKKILTLTL